MSNVPQDVIEQLRLDVGNNQCTVSTATALAELVSAYDQLRAQRSNAEPVAIVTVGSQDHGPFSYRETAYGIDHLPDGESKLYTAPPDAGFAAGMMKAAELAHGLLRNSLLNRSAESVRSTILSAIPADSKAALREVCMKVAEKVCAEAGALAINTKLQKDPGTARYELNKRLEAIVNSVLEGKS